MRYRIVPNRPLHFRIAAHLETSGPLGQDANELAERCGASVDDVEATLVVLAATGDVEAVIASPDLARQLEDARFIAEQRRKDLVAANKLVEDHAHAQVAAESRVRELETEVARMRSGAWLPSAEDASRRVQQAYEEHGKDITFEMIGAAVLDLVRARLGGTS